VRVGDVYGLMIEHYGQGGNYKQVEYTTFKCNTRLSLPSFPALQSQLTQWKAW